MNKEEAIKILNDYDINFERHTPEEVAEAHEMAIKVLEQKTGHWVLSGGFWRCSECKEKALLKLDRATGGYREYEQIRSKYCPNCGARMEAKE